MICTIQYAVAACSDPNQVTSNPAGSTTLAKVAAGAFLQNAQCHGLQCCVTYSAKVVLPETHTKYVRNLFRQNQCLVRLPAFLIQQWWTEWGLQSRVASSRLPPGRLCMYIHTDKRERERERERERKREKTSITLLVIQPTDFGDSNVSLQSFNVTLHVCSIVHCSELPAPCLNLEAPIPLPFHHNKCLNASILPPSPMSDLLHRNCGSFLSHNLAESCLLHIVLGLKLHCPCCLAKTTCKRTSQW